MLKVFKRSSASFLYTSTLIAIIHLMAFPLMAQQSGNPFEIKPRLGQMPESTGPAAIDTPTGNPFDIKVPTKESASPVTEKTVPLGLEGPDAITPPAPLDGFILALMIFNFFLVTILITLFRPYFQKVFHSITNDNMLSQVYREYQQGRVWPFLVLYFMFFVNAGIFLFLLIRKVFDLQFDYGHLTLLLLCILLVASIFLFKHLLLFFTGRIFPVRKEINLYNFTIIIYSILIGIGLLIGNTALGLGSPKILFPSFLVISVFIGLVYLLRAFRGLLIGSRFIPLYIFHFLLYICTAEIAPVAVLAKLISNQL